MPQATPYCYIQDPEESLSQIPRHGDGPAQVRFTHIVNIYDKPCDEQQRAVQKLTLETIRIAAKAASPRVTARCVCVTAADELHLVPADFIAAPPLSRSVLELGDFSVRRPLPLLFDILDKGLAAPQTPPAIAGCEDYIVFTNADIHLQPHFYDSVLEWIKEGYEVIDIHRRTLPACVPDPSQLAAMFADFGRDHPGVDCFVFPRRMYPGFVRNNACVGVLHVMRGLVFNLAVHARRYLVLARAQLTFHIGDDRTWQDGRYGDYTRFNMDESKKVARALAADKAGAEKLLTFLRATNAARDYIWAAMETAGGGHGMRAQLWLLALRRRLRRLVQAVLFPIWSRLPEQPKRLVRMVLYGRPGTLR